MGRHPTAFGDPFVSNVLGERLYDEETMAALLARYRHLEEIRIETGAAVGNVEHEDILDVPEGNHCVACCVAQRVGDKLTKTNLCRADVRIDSCDCFEDRVPDIGGSRPRRAILKR